MTGTSNFIESCKTFTSYITQRLKIERSLTIDRKADPDADTAWGYTRGIVINWSLDDQVLN